MPKPALLKIDFPSPYTALSCGQAGYLAAQLEELVTQAGITYRYKKALERNATYYPARHYESERSNAYTATHQTLRSTAFMETEKIDRLTQSFQSNAETRLHVAATQLCLLREGQNVMREHGINAMDMMFLQSAKVKSLSVSQWFKDQLHATGLFDAHRAKTARCNLQGIHKIESDISERLKPL